MASQIFKKKVGWGGKINDRALPSTDLMFICEITNANLSALYGEGRG